VTGAGYWSHTLKALVGRWVVLVHRNGDSTPGELRSLGVDEVVLVNEQTQFNIKYEDIISVEYSGQGFAFEGTIP
jgi:hypothetical protein